MRPIARLVSLRIVFSPLFVFTSAGLVVSSVLTLSRGASLEEHWTGISRLVLVLVSLWFGRLVLGPDLADGTAMLVMMRPIRRSHYLLARFVGFLVPMLGLFALSSFLPALQSSELMVLIRATVSYAAFLGMTAGVLAFLGSVVQGNHNLLVYLGLLMILIFSPAGLLIPQNVLPPEAYDALLSTVFFDPVGEPMGTVVWQLGYAAVSFALAVMLFSRRQFSLATVE